MAARKKAKQREKETDLQSRQERDKLICYRYAQCRNASTVGKEFGVSRMYVTRAWGRLSEDEQNALLDTSQQVDEELNQKILDAERIAGDAFVRKIVQAREIAAEELLRRFTGPNIKMISNKDFTSMLRLIAAISATEKADEHTETQDTFRLHRESIREDIDNPQNIDSHE